MLPARIIVFAVLVLPAGVSRAQTDASQVMDPSISQEEFSGPLKLVEDVSDHPDSYSPVIQNRGQGNGNGNMSPTAVPANNDCANAITLIVDAACVNGTNKEAGVQSGESTACQGTITKSVWYKFVATATSLFVEVELTATNACYLSSAVYSGSCLPASSLSCENAAGGPNLNIHNLTGLTVGTTYYVQVSYTGGGICGNNSNANTGADFCIKVGTPQSCSTCNTPCGPICIYPSPPTVPQVTSTCTAYQLKPRLNNGQSRTQCYTFNAVSTSFSLQMIINTIGCSGGNVSAFNWQLYPSGCGSVLQSGNLSNLNATGLTIGAAYVLCYSWTALCQHNSVYPYIVATSPLPVTLLSFEGKQMEEDILLSWSTASETNNQYFSVERSPDGIHFETAGQVSGAGNSNQVIQYRFTDINPLPGINYYRLTQVDFDGLSTTSAIIAIRYYKNFSVKVENNPVEDELNISVHAEYTSLIKIRLINDLGETVQEFSTRATKGFNQISIPVMQLHQGMYFLKSENGPGTSWTRFLKL